MTLFSDLSFLVLAGLIGGVVNVMAGGAKLFVFPMLLAAGLPPLVANATATVGLWPAQLPGVWTFPKSLTEDRQGHILDAIITATGAVVGAMLLYALGEAVFLPMVPAFHVVAVIAILFGDQLSKLGLHMAGRNRAAARAMFLLTGVYAGYFGAGYGFLIVAAVFLAGEHSVHIATARKNFISLGANTAAAIPLSLTGLVAWDAAVAVTAQERNETSKPAKYSIRNLPCSQIYCDPIGSSTLVQGLPNYACFRDTRPQNREVSLQAPPKAVNCPFGVLRSDGRVEPSHFNAYAREIAWCKMQASEVCVKPFIRQAERGNAPVANEPRASVRL